MYRERVWPARSNGALIDVWVPLLDAKSSWISKCTDLHQLDTNTKHSRGALSSFSFLSPTPTRRRLSRAKINRNGRREAGSAMLWTATSLYIRGSRVKSGLVGLQLVALGT